MINTNMNRIVGTYCTVQTAQLYPLYCVNRYWLGS